MLKSSRAALALGLGMFGVVGFVVPSMGQDPAVRPASGNATAQPAAPKPPAPALIGTIDMDAVFRGYDKLKTGGEAINAEALARQSELMKIKTDGQAEVDKLQKLTPGDPGRKRIEDRITELEAKSQATQKQAQADLSRREAELLANVYVDVQKMTEAVAKQRGLNLIVKSSTAAVSATDPASIRATIYQSVIYADPKFDLTADVTKWLNYYYYQKGGQKPKGNSEATDAAPAAAAVPGTSVPR